MQKHKRGWKPTGLTGIVLVFALALTACRALNLPGSEETNPTIIPTAENRADSTPVGTSEPVGPVTLNVWLPPEFNPSAGDLAATMLQARIAEFEERHPNTRVEVRLKAETGAGNLYEALSAAQRGAPLALPDLVLMPGGLLPQAVADGLLRPMDEFLDDDLGEDWYLFAQDMFAQANRVYSIPFVGDGLVLVYRPTAVETPPRTWEEIIAGQMMLGLAAADPSAVFTLTQLLAQAAEYPALDQFPEVDQDALTAVFEFYTLGNSRSIFPFWLTQFTTHEQSWQAFTEGRLPMVAAWSSRFIENVETTEYAAGPLPTPDGETFTLVKGWGWTVTSPNDERAALAAELAASLSDPAFLAQWSAAAGYLPARSSSLAAWAPDERQALASRILPTARILPNDNARTLIGGHISEAVIALLKQEISPNQAVQNVLEGLEEGTETP